MLLFIGMGLHDEGDMTLRGLEEARSCDVLFAEFYTSAMAGLGMEKLQSLVGKKIIILARRDIEEKTQRILDEAKTKRVCLLVPGDPLISTTHVALRIEAKRRGIATKVIHNASIFSAAPSISGLQNYKFGRSTSVAFPQPGFTPKAPYDAIKENKLRKLHTLLFLDIRVEVDKRILMTANEAMRVLLDIEKGKKEKFFTEETLCVVIGNAGSFDPVLRAGKVKELINQDFGTTPHALIVTGELHFMEEEYLREFAGLKEGFRQ